MPKLPTLWQTFKKEVLSLSALIFIFIISFIYFSFAVFLLNYRLVLGSILGNYPLNFKINILFQLLIGSYSAFSLLDFFLLIITSILVGLNILLISKILIRLRTAQVKLSFAVGGSTVLGIVVAGCSSCGFSVLSLLGITGALSFIPFKATGLHAIIITLLIFSFWYSLKNYHQKIVCKIK